MAKGPRASRSPPCSRPPAQPLQLQLPPPFNSVAPILRAWRIRLRGPTGLDVFDGSLGADAEPTGLSGSGGRACGGVASFRWLLGPPHRVARLDGGAIDRPVFGPPRRCFPRHRHCPGRRPAARSDTSTTPGGPWLALVPAVDCKLVMGLRKALVDFSMSVATRATTGIFPWRAELRS